MIARGKKGSLRWNVYLLAMLGVAACNIQRDDGAEVRDPTSPPSEPADAGTSPTPAEEQPTGEPAPEEPPAPVAMPADEPTHFSVNTKAELLSALAAARPGSVVYVEEGAVIDLTGMVAIVIPARVTLAGSRGRGSALGAMLFTNQHDTKPLFQAGGDGVHITGLRIRGPDSGIGTSSTSPPTAQGILASWVDNLRVDHCELSGWSHTAILLSSSKHAYIHDNSIHHNRRTGLGYGTTHKGASSSLIERNTYDYNRHDIAGTGERAIVYEARYNRVGVNGNGHSFDMHGENEALENGAPWAGDVVRIHHNTFLDPSGLGVMIRGRPVTGGFINDNCFAMSSADAIRQLYFTGNLFISNNYSSLASGTCHTVAGPSNSKRSDVNGDGLADLITLFVRTAFTHLGGTAGTLGPSPSTFHGTLDSALTDGSGLLVIDVRDVNKDGYADLVTAHHDGNVKVYLGTREGNFNGGTVSSFSGTYDLSKPSQPGFDPIAVADVHGDGYADLVSHHGGSVYVHPGQSSGAFARSAESFAGTFDAAVTTGDGTGHFPVDVADVTGDGRADLVTLHHTGTAYVFPGQSSGLFGNPVPSFAGTMANALLTGTGFEPISVADVTGDARADLITLHTNGTVYVYPGTATGAFAKSVTSFAGTMRSALFGGTGHDVIDALDITGDGHADLVTAHNNGNVYVYPGTASGTFGNAAVNFTGKFMSRRFHPGGYELLNQKSLQRRRGCTATGCF